ncbi:CARDB domain-containing protein [Halomicroarcula sp. GCM10025710]
MYTYEVRTEDDASASSLTIHQPATFDVTELNGTLDVVRGETANLTGTVENVGDVEGTQTVALMHDGKAVENRTVTLASGESTDLEFSVATANRTRGNYTYAVVSSDYSAAADLRVRNSEFTVTDLRGNETVYIGDPMVFTATVKNTGDAPDTQTLEFKLDIDGDDQPESYGITQNVTLAANETKDVVFDLPYMEDPDPFPVEDFITGTFIYSVHAEDSKMSAVFVAKWPPYSGSGGSADDGTGDVTNGDGTGDETNGDGTGDASEDIEYTTLDEISVAKTNLHYDEPVTRPRTRSTRSSPGSRSPTASTSLISTPARSSRESSTTSTSHAPRTSSSTRSTWTSSRPSRPSTTRSSRLKRVTPSNRGMNSHRPSTGLITRA